MIKKYEQSSIYLSMNRKSIGFKQFVHNINARFYFIIKMQDFVVGFCFASLKVLSWCKIDNEITTLFFLVRKNISSHFHKNQILWIILHGFLTLPFLLYILLYGMYGLFFFSVPTSVNLHNKRCFANGNVVKKLSIVIFLPEFLNGAANSFTTLLSWFFSRLVADFPIYKMSVRGYQFSASHIHHTFIPYLAGFEGMYWVNLVRSRLGKSCSSIVKFSVGVNVFFSNYYWTWSIYHESAQLYHLVDVSFAYLDHQNK